MATTTAGTQYNQWVRFDWNKYVVPKELAYRTITTNSSNTKSIEEVARDYRRLADWMYDDKAFAYKPREKKKLEDFF